MQEPGSNDIFMASAAARRERLSLSCSLFAAVAGFDDRMSLAAAVVARREAAPVLGRRVVELAGIVVIAERAVIDMIEVLAMLSVPSLPAVLAAFHSSRPPRPDPRPVPLPMMQQGSFANVW